MTDTVERDIAKVDVDRLVKCGFVEVVGDQDMAITQAGVAALVAKAWATVTADEDPYRQDDGRRDRAAGS